MKEYKKPYIEEEKIELEDIIATSFSLGGIFDLSGDGGDGEDL